MPLYFTKGGLKYWVESAGTFAAKAWSSFTPKTTETNADAVISPKGNGALIGQVPDGTVAGGNARGTRAIDLQLGRTNADEVAGANRSAILSGNSNKIIAGADNSAILTGEGNTVSGVNSTVINGQGNVVSTDLSTIDCGVGVSARTHHSQATGYAKAQRHIADFYFYGTTTTGQTVTAIAIPSSGVLTKDAKSILTIPANSTMVGKLNFSVKEAATANLLAWIDAQVIIHKGTSTPVISINKVDVVGAITGVSLAVVNSSTVTDGIEFQITSVNVKTLRAKATFEYDLIVDYAG